ncbi:ABC transporter permease [Paenibacillus oryzisoli]|uniref:ABC transporter permease n=1 Tax=Paenibacillus oryzisoli TaxID=1850517 RepID=UPI003D274352
MYARIKADQDQEHEQKHGQKHEQEAARSSGHTSRAVGSVSAAGRTRLGTWLVWSGLLLMLATTGLIPAVAGEWEQLGGTQGLGVLSANAAQSDSAGAGLTLKEAEALEENSAPAPVAYEARERATARAGTLAAAVEVHGVNGAYRDFSGAESEAGTRLSRTAVSEHSRVAVLGADAAEQLFRSRQVAGRTITLYGVPFTVIGVLQEKDSLLQRLSAGSLAQVWIPVTTMLDLQPETRIRTVQWTAGPSSAVSGVQEMTAALRSIGQNAANYSLTNSLLEGRVVRQWRDLLEFLFGGTAIWAMASLLLRQIQSGSRLLKQRLHTADWPDALSALKRPLLLHLAASVLLAGGIVGVWLAIRFRLYLPPAWLPEQLIDLPFYWEKVQLLWQQSNMRAGYAPSPQELHALAAGRLSAGLAAAGALAGLPSLLLGLRIWALAGLPLEQRLTRVLLWLPAAALLTAGAARWAGLTYTVEPTAYAIPALLAIATIINKE